MKVCERCFMAICSREGNLEHRVLYVDEENEQESTCEWCECSGYHKLYEI